MRIRVATSADVPGLIALEREADTAAHWSDAVYNSIFSGGAPPRLALVMEDGAGTTGFVIARIIGNEWEIENIVVAANLRGQGVGCSLLGELIAEARANGVERILLEVRASNVAARRLYAKAGFTPAGLRSGYYSDPAEDAICFILEIRAEK